MNDKDTKVPEIRFQGFTDAWEQRAWIDTVDISKNMVDPRTGKYDELPHIGPGNIESFTGQLLNNVKSVKAENLISSKFQFQSGDIIYGKINPQLAKYVLSDFEGLCSADAYVLNSKNGLEQNFLFRILQSKVFYDYSVSVSQRTGMPKINREELNQFYFNMPEAAEQTAIGNFFHTLDDAITLHKRKLDGLKELKRGYLQQMFPQAGESMPPIRFAGFTEPWQERRLGDVVERVQGNDGRMDLPTLTISAGNGWLDQRERFSNNIAGKEQENYTLLSKGELSYNKGNSKLAKYGVVFELKNYKEALVPRVYHSFKPTHESSAEFLEYIFATKIPDRELAKLITSGARMDGLLNINFESFVGIKIYIPTCFEQTAIGNFFRNLDAQISVQQQRLSQLIQLKSTYLQKMLV